LLVEIDFSEDIDQKEIEKVFKKEGTSMPLFLNSVMKNLKQVYHGLDPDRVVVVRICHENESTELNGQYLGKNYPTNILSFPFDDSDKPSVPLGNLAICWSVLERESLDQRKPLLDHVAHLFLHGVLHLLNFDHQTESSAEQMEAIEIKTLATMQIDNPYQHSGN
jgi:probable rRNA maturation factor